MESLIIVYISSNSKLRFQKATMMKMTFQLSRTTLAATKSKRRIGRPGVVRLLFPSFKLHCLARHAKHFASRS